MRYPVAAFVSGILLLASSSARAHEENTAENTYRLNVHKKHGSGACPGYFEVVEKSRFYEGGFEVSAVAWLQWMAGPFSFVQSKEKSVTWAAKLDRPYEHCQGKASIATIDGYPAEGANHLRAHLGSGYIYFTLDISSYGDMTAIMYQNITANNPSYRWAVAD